MAEKASSGDSSSLNELIAELRPEVVRVVRMVVGSGSWYAEDAAQEALLDISQNIETLKDPASVRSWAMKVAVSRAIKVARRERLRLLSLDRDQVPDVGQKHNTGFEQARLKQAFYQLPPKMRAIAILRLHVGLSEIETAHLVGCNVGTVKSQLHEARKRLAFILG